ncbi:TonB-dependent receptor [Sphingomonas kaistensis]|uniref:TonB-dependent receptor n=1 Tax=Sphingomonas kaistensis TaxID=298708 RepID=A0A7X5Y350_9SPHN|nr:TonB-dependent receptor [Sphingomonas kaistensis]NJC04264.1 TonB-dependent receptor [Sphingomonas kaistensis]
MRIRTFALASASFTAMAVATPAAAQQQPADPAVEQTSEADDAAAADDDTIVVTGLRRSLQSAVNLKRNSEQQIDAIVAEDIGKLPDIAVSETAARIPGLQVTRRGGEADTVLVRGLPDFATTYNGREIFTAETRVVALQDFPSANIAALEVYKTTTANLVEAGLAGEVNVRSRRPFDFQGLEIAGSAWALYTKQAGKWNPNVNLLVSNRWGFGDGGEIGVLLNYSRTELDYLDSEPSNTDFIAPGPAGRFPDIQRLFYRSGNRVRPSINGAIQLKVSPDVQFYVEGLWQGFRNKVSDRLWEQPLYGGTLSNVVLRPGTDLLSSGTVTNPGGDIFSFQGATFNKTDTYQFAAGGSADLGRLRLTADVARTRSTFRGSTESVDTVFRPTGPFSVNFNNEVPEFSYGTLPGLDNVANYRFRGLYEEDQKSQGDDWQFRVDGQYETGFGFLPTIEAGARYTTRDAARRFGNRYAFLLPLNIPASALPIDYAFNRPGFRGTDVQGFRSFLTPTYNSVRDSLGELRQFIISRCPSILPGDPGNGCASYTLDPVAADPRSRYTASEDSLAGYVQGRFAFGENFDGVLGLRAVRTESEVKGTSRINNVFTPVDVGNKYTDWLPNGSVRWRFLPGAQLRLSATQTRTKPTFADLNPASDTGAPVGQCNAAGQSTTSNPFDCVRRGGGGNPFLQPFKSNNYDASLEYYFGRGGLLAAAVFRRDLKGFFQNQTLRYIDPNLGALELNAPVNTNAAKIDGAEVQFSSFFDWGFVPGFLRNFGAQANLTYLETEITDPNTIIGQRDIYGVSKWTYNLVGMYENAGFSARVSYNKRGKFLGFIDIRDNNNPASFGGDYYYQYGKPSGRLDMSASYTINDRLTVFGDWTNILEKPYREYLSSARNGAARAEYIRFLRYDETTFSVGIRARL